MESYAIQILLLVDAESKKEAENIGQEAVATLDSFDALTGGYVE